MNNPCEWCKSTSEQIDSLEFELEAKDEEIESRQHADDMNTDLILKLTDDLEAKDKIISHKNQAYEVMKSESVS